MTVSFSDALRRAKQFCSRAPARFLLEIGIGHSVISTDQGGGKRRAVMLGLAVSGAGPGYPAERLAAAHSGDFIAPMLFDCGLLSSAHQQMQRQWHYPHVSRDQHAAEHDRDGAERDRPHWRLGVLIAVLALVSS
jgi:hypothetical protein